MAGAIGVEWLACRLSCAQNFGVETIGPLISQARTGAQEPVDRLFRATYQELRQLARHRLRRSPGITVLDTTVLVHECYLRLVHLERLSDDDRCFFLRYAAKAMRSIVIDLLRSRGADRNGAGALHVTLNTGVEEQMAASTADVLRINEALDALGNAGERLVQIVEMKYFAGLTFEEIATSLGISERTARRDWQHARLLLYTELTDGAGD
jgi:RNA polymerase sigma factor (TIGR02999 family)